MAENRDWWVVETPGKTFVYSVSDVGWMLPPPVDVQLYVARRLDPIYGQSDLVKFVTDRARRSKFSSAIERAKSQRITAATPNWMTAHDSVEELSSHELGAVGDLVLANPFWRALYHAMGLPAVRMCSMYLMSDTELTCTAILAACILHERHGQAARLRQHYQTVHEGVNMDPLTARWLQGCMQPCKNQQYLSKLLTEIKKRNSSSTSDYKLAEIILHSKQHKFQQVPLCVCIDLEETPSTFDGHRFLPSYMALWSDKDPHNIGQRPNPNSFEARWNSGELPKEFSTSRFQVFVPEFSNRRAFKMAMVNMTKLSLDSRKAADIAPQGTLEAGKHGICRWSREVWNKGQRVIEEMDQYPTLITPSPMAPLAYGAVLAPIGGTARPPPVGYPTKAGQKALAAANQPAAVPKKPGFMHAVKFGQFGTGPPLPDTSDPTSQSTTYASVAGRGRAHARASASAPRARGRAQSKRGHAPLRQSETQLPASDADVQSWVRGKTHARGSQRGQYSQSVSSDRGAYSDTSRGHNRGRSRSKSVKGRGAAGQLSTSTPTYTSDRERSPMVPDRPAKWQQDPSEKKEPLLKRVALSAVARHTPDTQILGIWPYTDFESQLRIFNALDRFHRLVTNAEIRSKKGKCLETVEIFYKSFYSNYADMFRNFLYHFAYAFGNNPSTAEDQEPAANIHSTLSSILSMPLLSEFIRSDPHWRTVMEQACRRRTGFAIYDEVPQRSNEPLYPELYKMQNPEQFMELMRNVEAYTDIPQNVLDHLHTAFVELKIIDSGESLNFDYQRRVNRRLGGAHVSDTNPPTTHKKYPPPSAATGVIPPSMDTSDSLSGATDEVASADESGVQPMDTLDPLAPEGDLNVSQESDLAVFQIDFQDQQPYVLTDEEIDIQVQCYIAAYTPSSLPREDFEELRRNGTGINGCHGIPLYGITRTDAPMVTSMPPELQMDLQACMTQLQIKLPVVDICFYPEELVQQLERTMDMGLIELDTISDHLKDRWTYGIPEWDFIGAFMTPPNWPKIIGYTGWISLGCSPAMIPSVLPEKQNSSVLVSVAEHLAHSCKNIVSLGPVSIATPAEADKLDSAAQLAAYEPTDEVEIPDYQHQRLLILAFLELSQKLQMPLLINASGLEEQSEAQLLAVIMTFRDNYPNAILIIMDTPWHSQALRLISNTWCGRIYFSFSEQWSLPDEDQRSVIRDVGIHRILFHSGAPRPKQCTSEAVYLPENFIKVISWVSNEAHMDIPTVLTTVLHTQARLYTRMKSLEPHAETAPKLE